MSNSLEKALGKKFSSLKLNESSNSSRIGSQSKISSSNKSSDNQYKHSSKSSKHALARNIVRKESI